MAPLSGAPSRGLRLALPSYGHGKKRKTRHQAGFVEIVLRLVGGTGIEPVTLAV
jgi:hypothetical protein